MRFSWPPLRTAALIFALAAAMFIVAGVVITPSPAQQAEPPSRGAPVVSEIASGADLAGSVRALQTRLDRLPGDHTAWASLGAAYVQQARITGDPSFYPRAEGAFDRSLEERPDRNDGALTGLASLAAARHDFAAARRFAEEAKAINPYSATNQGVLTDALIELGRYDEAFTELQRMVDLKPGVPSFTRVSYAWELRGETEPARKSLERAHEMAFSDSDAAYASFYLGELAWNSGDLDAAAEHYANGLRRDPTYVPLLAGKAKIAAARGDVETAVAGYDDVVRRLPEPSYVIEYADLLAALGRDEEASSQYALVQATGKLFEEAGVEVDLEFVLFDADHGRASAALAAAEALYDRRQSIHTEDAYAWALHVNGRDRQALAHAEAAAQLGTDSALFAYHRGMIEKSLGMDAKAQKSLRRSLALNPHFSPLHAPRAEGALEELAVSS